MEKESYIKFNCQHTYQSVELPQQIDMLIELGNALKHKGLIGKIDDTMGFGNISVKDTKTELIYISASKTGIPCKYTKEHFCRIDEWNAEKNLVVSRGQMPASSETLSHLAVYEALAWVRYVVHIHSESLWQSLLDKGLTSSQDIKYGTKEMYFEIVRLLRECSNQNLLVMGGHKNGLIFWDQDIASLKKSIFT